MNFQGILPGDNVFRASIYPLFSGGGRFVPGKMLNISEEQDGSLLTSLVWERYAPSSKYVHAFGQRLADKMNANMLAKHRKISEKNRKIYAGAYQITAQLIRDMGNGIEVPNVESADVIYHIEDGEIAHADLRIYLKNEIQDAEGIKTEIVDYIWRECSGPLTPKFGQHEQSAENASKILEVPSKGRYQDRRSLPIKLVYHLRFYVLYLWWVMCGQKT